MELFGVACGGRLRWSCAVEAASNAPKGWTNLENSIRALTSCVSKIKEEHLRNISKILLALRDGFFEEHLRTTVSKERFRPWAAILQLTLLRKDIMCD